MNSRVIAIWTGVVLSVATAHAQQCTPGWSDQFFLEGPQGYRGQGHMVTVMVEFDDGTGPSLYAAGNFSHVNGQTTAGIARWDGSHWHPVQGGVDGRVEAMTVFDDGSGPALYVGGIFDNAGGVPAKNIARWDGSTWSPLTTGVYFKSGAASTVLGLTVATHQGQSFLYVAGVFDTAGTVTASAGARWDGSRWTSLGLGTNRRGYRLETHRIGGIDQVIAGGTFSTGGIWLESFDGSAWRSMQFPYTGDNIVMTVRSIAFGSQEPTLYVGLAGHDEKDLLYTNAGAGWVREPVTYSSSGWGSVYSIIRHDNGSGPELYISGNFDQPQKRIARKPQGAGAWQSIGASSITTYPRVIHSFDHGSGPILYAGGPFNSTTEHRGGFVLQRSGQSWRDVGPSNAPFRAYDAVSYDDGNGMGVYVSGTDHYGERFLNGLAKWDGSQWQSAGAIGLTSRLFVCDSTRGKELLLTGEFRNPGDPEDMKFGRWDGTRWVEVAHEPPGEISAVAYFDAGNGEELYIGGTIYDSFGYPSAYLNRWDGGSWVEVGKPPSGDRISQLAVGDFGAGPRLIVCGPIREIGGVPVPSIASYNGSTWSAMPGNINDDVVSLLVHHRSASSDILYAGGLFTSPYRYLASWDGTRWSPVGPATDNYVADIQLVNRGNGDLDLYVSGSFQHAGTTPANFYAKWDGSQWTALGSGTDHFWGGIVIADLGEGISIFTTGRFLSAGGHSSYTFAQWKTCESLCPADCDQSTGSGVLDIFDFLCFQNSFVTGGAYACDCDTSTGQRVCDIFDFLCYQNAFVSGCP